MTAASHALGRTREGERPLQQRGDAPARSYDGLSWLRDWVEFFNDACKQKRNSEGERVCRALLLGLRGGGGKALRDGVPVDELVAERRHVVRAVQGC